MLWVNEDYERDTHYELESINMTKTEWDEFFIYDFFGIFNPFEDNFHFCIF